MALDYFSQGGTTQNSFYLDWAYDNTLAYAVKIRITGTGINFTSSTIFSGSYLDGSELVNGLSSASTYTYTLTVLRNSDSSTIGTRTLDATTFGPAPTFSGSFSSAPINSYYSQSISVSGASSDVALDSGSLPAGLSGSGSTTGYTISGTPSTLETANFTLRAFGNSQFSYQSYSLVVRKPHPTWSDNTITTTTYKNVAYSDAVSASGGGYAVSYSISSGSLPAGITLNTSTGAISGTPTATGTSSFRVTATNGSGSDISVDLSIAVSDAPAASFTDSTLSTSIRVSTAYSDGVVASNASRYAITSGTLPAGLSLNTSTGTVTGTPTTAGSSTFSIQAYNVANVGASTGPLSFTLNVLNLLPVWTDSSIVTTGLKVGVAYSDSVAASNAAAYAVTTGSLPAGLTLNTTTGAITGTPTTAASYSFVIGARNANNEYINTSTFNITVAPSGGKVRVYNGSSWVESTVRVYNGSSWVEAPVYVYNGSTWVKSL